ncbi:Ubiquitin carboxyl-terminal hydrolase 11 [Balamuthia mandrillaris]
MSYYWTSTYGYKKKRMDIEGEGEEGDSDREDSAEMEIQALPQQERDIVKRLLAKDRMRLKHRYYLVSMRWWQLWKQYVRFDVKQGRVEKEGEEGKEVEGGEAYSAVVQRPGAIDNTELIATEEEKRQLEKQEAEGGDHTAKEEREEQGRKDKEEERERKEQMTVDDGGEKEGEDEQTATSVDTLKRGLTLNVDYVLVPRTVWKRLYAWYGAFPVVERSVIAVGILQTLQVELYPITIRMTRRQPISSTASSRPIKPLPVDEDHPTEECKFSRTAKIKDMRRHLAGIMMFPPHKTTLYLQEGRTVRPVPQDMMEHTLEELNIRDGQIVHIQGQPPTLDSAYHRSYGSSPRSYAPQIVNVVGTPPVVGATGLYNLGNTCFMNSALQCLSNTTPLLRYFLQDVYLTEINPTNPLGMKGDLAKSFAELLKLIWSGRYTSVVPREFKSILSKYAPQFSGYQQHDSQEFLTFVLDGLHEDLNRVVDKPYMEEGLCFVPHQSDVERAEISWARHLQRNQSVIVDLFQGQLQSAVTCPTCDHVSVTFDPFMFLSLPVPSKDQRLIPVYLFWMSDHHNANNKERKKNSVLVKYGVRVSKMGTMKDLKEALARLVGLQPEQLLLADIYSCRAFVIPDGKRLFDVRSSDVVYAYEVLPPSAEWTIVGEEDEDKMQEESKDESERKGKEKEEDKTRITEDGTTSIKGKEEETKDDDRMKEAPTEMKKETCENESKEKMVLVEKDEEEEAGKGKMVVEEKEEKGKEKEIGKDKEENAKKLKQSTKRIVNNIAHVYVLHRKRTSSIRSSNNKHQNSFFLFSKPFIISFDRTLTTRAQLHKMIRSQVSRFLFDEAEAREDEHIEERLPLLKLFVVDSLGATEGAVMPPDDELWGFDDQKAIAIEWDKDLLASLPQKKEDYAIHESLNLTEADNELQVSLADCLDLFTTEELLSDSSSSSSHQQSESGMMISPSSEPTVSWFCPSCKTHRPGARKKMQLWNAPPILILHLKRFQYTHVFREKLTTMVEFPAEGLDLSPFVHASSLAAMPQGAKENSLIYDLYAVSNHMGGLGSGHYTALAKNMLKGEWYKLNDSSAHKIEGNLLHKELCTSDAYLLFYKRRSLEDTSSMQCEWLQDFLASSSSSSPSSSTSTVQQEQQPKTESQEQTPKNPTTSVTTTTTKADQSNNKANNDVNVMGPMTRQEEEDFRLAMMLQQEMDEQHHRNTAIALAYATSSTLPNPSSSLSSSRKRRAESDDEDDGDSEDEEDVDLDEEEDDGRYGDDEREITERYNNLTRSEEEPEEQSITDDRRDATTIALHTDNKNGTPASSSSRSSQLSNSCFLCAHCQCRFWTLDDLGMHLLTVHNDASLFG